MALLPRRSNAARPNLQTIELLRESACGVDDPDPCAVSPVQVADLACGCHAPGEGTRPLLNWQTPRFKADRIECRLLRLATGGLESRCIVVKHGPATTR
jgi:hypothetical protein